jgi:hypothetical protein
MTMMDNLKDPKFLQELDHWLQSENFVLFIQNI